MTRTRYCGAPSVSPARWLRLSKEDEPSSDHPQFRDRHIIGTYSGRAAIALACQLLNIGPDDDVLVPAYNCGSEIDAVLHAGAKTIGYRVTRDCEIDLEDLAARKTSRTKALYVIPYFGWEPPLARLRHWCDEHGLLLIEDCALALYSHGHGAQIGRLSDAAIYSLPKTLGTYHGGLLTLKNTPATKPALSAAGRATLISELKLSTKATLFRTLDRIGLYGTLQSLRRPRTHPGTTANTALPDMPATYYFESAIHQNRALHPAAAALASNTRWEEIVKRRRQNYLQLANALGNNHHATLLFKDLPEGVCPLSLPLVVSNRDACVAQLQARGIAAYPWWAGYHRTAIDWTQFPDARWLKNNLLTLPLHQGLDDHHIDYMTSVVQQISGLLNQ